MKQRKPFVALETAEGGCMKRPLTDRNLHALLSVHFLPNWLAYFASIVLLLMYTSIFATYVLWCIIFVLTGVPIKFWHALVQSCPQLLSLLVGSTPDASQAQGVNYILL